MQQVAHRDPEDLFYAALIQYYQRDFGEVMNTLARLETGAAGTEAWIAAMMRGYVYAARGELAQARMAFDASAHHFGGVDNVPSIASGLLAGLGYVYGRTGDTHEARKLIRRLDTQTAARTPSPLLKALVYWGFGEQGKAKRLVDEAIESNDVEVIWKSMDPMYVDLLKLAH